jgi:acetoin utilization deacetylase AcuC-like enzyme
LEGIVTKWRIDRLCGGFLWRTSAFLIESESEKTILIYYDPVFLKHDTGDHPENAQRLMPTIRHLNSLALNATVRRPSWQPATIAQVRLVHTDAHVQLVQTFASQGGGFIEPDTHVSPASFDVALQAAGAVCDAIKRIDAGEDTTAFCLVRPPGHHAASERVAGFCLLNNVAIGARVANRDLGYQRVLIVDWDVHHGDGTQAIFWEDPNVAYFSMHRDSFYPFTGHADETGAGVGKGTIQNLPIRFGTPREQQLASFRAELTAFADRIKPELILISAGFDAHRDDPIGSLGLEAVDFAELTQTVIEIANQYAGGKIVSVLEGGYHPDALAASVDQHLQAMLESSPGQG